jgi:hypothetical protein
MVGNPMKLYNPWVKIADLEGTLEVREVRIIHQANQIDTKEKLLLLNAQKIGRLTSELADERVKVARLEKAAIDVENVLQTARTEIRDEGCPCPCGGTFEYGPVENCSCHVNPPCSQCVNNPLRCPKCYWTSE